MKIRETLRNARFIGEMAAKGVERQVRSWLTPPARESAGEAPTASATVAHEDEPFEGYDLLTARQIIAQCREWTPTVRATARRYEEATRGRRSVIQALT